MDLEYLLPKRGRHEDEICRIFPSMLRTISGSCEERMSLVDHDLFFMLAKGLSSSFSSGI